MADKADVVVNNVTYRDVPGIQLTAAGGGTVTYNLVDYPIAIEKGGTGATTSADALIQLGAVAKSGDTMTGDLQAIEIRATNKSTSNYATFAFKDRTTASGIIAGYVAENVSTRRILFGEYTPETNREVYFSLPELSSSDTAAGYDIVTTKGDYVMGGVLTAPEMRIKNDSYPSFYYQTTSGMIGRTLVNHTSHNMSFREMKSGQHFDSFTLPTPTLTETTDNYYDIVTTKGNYTMGGTLSALAPISSYHSTTPSFAYKTSASGSPIAESAARANTRQIFFREYASDTAYHEDYLLPEHSTGATGNAIYDIVTTKGSYTLGGRLTAPGYTTKSTNGYPNIYFQNNGTDTGFMTHETATRRFIFSEYPTDSSSYYEAFMVPAPNTGLTANQFYTILTTKEHPAYTAQTLDWSSSQYITNNYDTWVEKALDTVRFQGLFNLTGLTANTTITLGTIPDGYRPGHSRSVRTIGFSMTPNWNTPGNIGASFIFVTINTNGVVTVNPGANVVNGGFWIDTTWVI